MRKPFKKHQINKSIARAFSKPTWHTRLMVRLDDGAIRLHHVRPDLTIKLIKEKMIELINTSSRNDLRMLDPLGRVSSNLYNKACAGKPMPWEIENA